MRNGLLWASTTLLVIALAGQVKAEMPEASMGGLFSSQSVTLTLGPQGIAPFLQAKGFAPGDEVELTHNGHGRMRIKRMAPKPSLTMTFPATDYLSPFQVREMLSALGLQTEGPATPLIKGDSIAAVVTTEGGQPSSLLARRGFKPDDRVTVTHIGERLRIEQVGPAKPVALVVSLGAYLNAEAFRGVAGAFGRVGTPPAPAVDVPAVPTGEPETERAEAEIAQAQAELEQTILEANQGQAVEAAEADQLKALLPESLDGLTNVTILGERVQMMGADLATASGRYEKDGDRDTYIKIKLLDLGNLSGFLRDGMVSWQEQSFDNTTEHGYVKTTDYQGHKALEEWDGQRRIGSVQVYVGKRFLVSVEGRKVAMNAVHNALDQIDMATLASLGSAATAGTSPPETDDVTASTDAGASDIRTMMKQLRQTDAGALVAPDTLKTCLPDAAAGLKRVEIHGQRREKSGVSVTFAAARYKEGTPGEIAISIMDTGTMSPELRMGMAPWNMMNVARESDTGYQKTTTFDKYRAYEVVDRTTRQASVTIFPANRFFIDVTGIDVSIEKVRQALAQVDLEKIESLATR